MVIRLRKSGKILLCILCLILLGFAVKFGIDRYGDMAYPKKYSEIVTEYAQKYQVDEDLIYAVIKTESGFNPEAVSVNNAKGLMQITEDTFNWIGTKLGYTEYQHDDLFEPRIAIEYGTFFLSYLLDEFQNTDVALAAYHAGRGITNKWLQDERYSSDGKTLTQIPYRDTAHYVQKVERYYHNYQRRSGAA
jgi:soluble lytic murein transglycosylase